MKKLFTLVALLAVFLGAKADWNQVYKIDYSEYNGFPFYVMGYVPEFDNGCLTDFGALYGYKTDAEIAEGDFNEVGTVTTQGGVVYHKVLFDAPDWHQYFIADGIPTKLDGKYKVVAHVKATANVSINVNMGWNWSGGVVGATASIPEGGDFQEVTWEYSGINGQNCNLVAQPGNSTETIEWQDLVVYEWVKPGGRVPVWLEDIDNGDAEKSWAELGLADVKHSDMENNFKVCAWGKERGENLNGDGGWDPFPATIEEEDGNHFFVVHGKEATTDGDAAAWDNQFFIQSKHGWAAGTTIKLKFKYKASKAVTVPTQTHNQMPSNYLVWHGCGEVKFTEEWQTYDNTVTFADDMNGGWSFAFQLNQNDKSAIDFYFDDLSWQYLKLDDGYFISGINATTTDSYDDLDNAVQFELIDPEDEYNYVATFGTEGDAKTYVDQVMISTKRGDDQAFKGATLKPTSNPKKSDPEKWIDFEPSSNWKIDLPGLGVWKVYLDLEYSAMAFEMLEGTPYEQPDPIDVVTNNTEIVVNGDERDWLPVDKDGNPVEAEIGNGATWDNQFFIVANRPLKKGEVTVLTFKYKADKGTAESPVKTSTQCHGAPGAYMHYAAIGDVMFTTESQDFSKEFTIPAEGDGMQSIAFNMAEIKEACKYEITAVQWYLKDPSLSAGQTYENLIDGEGVKNFVVKEGAGTAPSVFGTKQYAITVAETVNGTASALKKQYEGAGVTIATMAADGYEVDEVKVSCKNIDLAVEVTDAGVDKETGAHNYSFEMPADEVTISVTFKVASGINSIAADKAKIGSAVLYNLAGQRVAKDYKGIVVKEGKKIVNK